MAPLANFPPPISDTIPPSAALIATRSAADSLSHIPPFKAAACCRCHASEETVLEVTAAYSFHSPFGHGVGGNLHVHVFKVPDLEVCETAHASPETSCKGVLCRLHKVGSVDDGIDQS